MDSSLSIIGSVASIVSAFWAFFEARKARKSANEVMKYQKEIKTRIESSALDRLHDETKSVLHKVSYFGPSCNMTSIRGKSAQNVALEVEEYTRLLREHSVHFDDLNIKNKIDKICNELMPNVKGLSEGVSFDDKKKYGSNIYLLIERLLPITNATRQSIALKQNI